MSWTDYLKEVEENDKKVKDDGVKGAILDFFATNSQPDDEQIHKLADGLGISPHDLETNIYSILSSFLSKGKYNETKPEDIDQKQLEKGMKIEKEHTDSDAIARRIALDHLAEIPDYYDRLEKMEADAKSGKE